MKKAKAYDPLDGLSTLALHNLRSVGATNKGEAAGRIRSCQLTPVSPYTLRPYLEVCIWAGLLPKTADSDLAKSYWQLLRQILYAEDERMLLLMSIEVLGKELKERTVTLSLARKSALFDAYGVLISMLNEMPAPKSEDDDHDE